MLRSKLAFLLIGIALITWACGLLPAPILELAPSPFPTKAFIKVQAEIALPSLTEAGIVKLEESPTPTIEPTATFTLTLPPTDTPVPTPTFLPTETPLPSPTQTLEPSATPDKNASMRVKLKVEDGPLAVQLWMHSQMAQILGLKPYVEFDAVWCTYCKPLRKYATDPRMIRAYAGIYIIQLDIDAWRHNLSGSGINYVGVPSFYELDSEGKPTGHKLIGAGWGEGIPEKMAPYLAKFFRTGSN